MFFYHEKSPNLWMQPVPGNPLKGSCEGADSYFGGYL